MFGKVEWRRVRMYLGIPILLAISLLWLGGCIWHARTDLDETGQTLWFSSSVDSPGEINLGPLWQKGQYWTVETYIKNGTLHTPDGIYFAADFYYSSNYNRPDLFRYWDGEPGVPILAPHDGEVAIFLYEVTGSATDKHKFQEINISKIRECDEFIPRNSFKIKNINKQWRYIDVELVINAKEGNKIRYQTIYAHLSISGDFFTPEVLSKIKEIIEKQIYEKSWDPNKPFSDLLSTGRSVRRGDVIGAIDRWGLARSPHLHFEVRGSPTKLLLGPRKDLREVKIDGTKIFDDFWGIRTSDGTDVYLYRSMPRRTLCPGTVVKVNSIWNTKQINVRKEPGGEILGQVTHGTVGTVLAGPKIAKIGITGKWHIWYQVRFPGLDGWVAGEYLDPVERSTTRGLKVAVLNNPGLWMWEKAFAGMWHNDYSGVMEMWAEPGLHFSVLTPSEIAAGKLTEYDVLVLIDNSPDYVLGTYYTGFGKYVRDWWLSGGGVVALDSSIGFLIHWGILPPGDPGRDIRDVYGLDKIWVYNCNMLVKIKTANHPVTKGYTVNTVYSIVQLDALNQETGLPSEHSPDDAVFMIPSLPREARVLATNARGIHYGGGKERPNEAAIVAYEPPQGGRVVFITCDNVRDETLNQMYKNAIKWVASGDDLVLDSMEWESWDLEIMGMITSGEEFRGG